MKTRLILYFLLTFLPFTALAQLTWEHQIEAVNQWKELLKNRKIEELSARVEYPLIRQNPLWDITDAADFQKRFDEIFDEELIQEILRSDPTSEDWYGRHEVFFKDGTIRLDQNCEKLVGIGGMSKTEERIAAQMRPLNEKEILEKVLLQLGYSEDRIYDRFLKIRKLPYDETTSAVILPVIREFGDYNDHVLDACVLLVQNLGGKILEKYYEESAWVSDASGDGESEIFDIQFDFAPFIVRPEQRAFGVKVLYMSSSMLNHWTADELALFLPDRMNRKLCKILSNFEVSSRAQEGDDPDAGIYREAKTILIISGKTGYDGYADIIAKERVKRIKESRDSNGEVHVDSEEDLTAKEGGSRVLKFDGHVYVDPWADGDI